jgi:hypothetical protein
MNATMIGLGVLCVLGIGGCTLMMLLVYARRHGFGPWSRMGGLALVLVCAWVIGTVFQRLTR